MRRMARTELLRSGAKVAGVLFVLAGLGLQGLTVRAWGGLWTTLALNQRGLLYLLLPMAVGLGALQGRRERRSLVAELVSSTARPRWQQIMPVSVVMALTVVVAYLLVFAICTIWVAGSATYFNPVVIPIVLIGALAMVAAVWLGLAVGRVAPSLFVPPAMAGLTLLLLVGPSLISQESADQGGSTVSLLLLSPVMDRSPSDWDTVPGRLLIAHLVLLVGLACAGLLLCAARSVRLPLVAAALVAVATVVSAGALPKGGLTVRHIPDPGAARLVCADGGPQVCVTAVHAGALAEVAPVIRRALAGLAKLPDAPSSARERHTFSWSEHPEQTSPGTLLFSFTTRSNRLDQPDLLERVLDGVATDDWPYLTKKESVAARRAAGAWLIGAPPRQLGQPEATDIDTLAQEYYRTLCSFPAAEQVRRMVALREAARRRDRNEDLAAILVGGGR